LHALAIKIGTDLIRIGGADGGQQVTAAESAAHEIDGVAVGKTKITCILVVDPQKVGAGPAGTDALIPEVVDGENCLQMQILRMPRVLSAQEHGNKCGMPVITVENLGLKVLQMRDTLQNAFAKESGTLPIIRITVNTVALKIILVVNKIADDAMMGIYAFYHVSYVSEN
jgi:hypothetical protein